MARKYRIISADGHVETPPDPWVAHVPGKFRDRAPRLIHLPDDQGDAWLVEGKPMLHTGQNVTGPGPVKFAFASYTTKDGKPSPGTGDAKQRLREQDQDGIDAEVLFAPLFATRFIEGIKDREVYLAIVRAYNEWLAEEYCSVAPDRLIGNAFIPVSGIEDAIAELEYAKSVGLRTVQLQQFPNGSGKAELEDDRFWEKALELGMALSPHVNFGGDRADIVQARTDPRGYPAYAGISQHSAGNVPAFTLAQMIVGGVFDRLPELRFYFAESNCSLLPGMLYYLDRDYIAYNDWFQLSLKKMPSEYVIEHCWFGMVQEMPAIKMGAAGIMPLEWFMWGSDFPHSIGTFPRSHDYIADAFAGVNEESKRKILIGNAAAYFGLDLDADITETPTP
jgi:predicted TIM-barrel fold metal-dependent hydrolase